LQENFDYRNVPFYILLGIMAGYTALYYARIFKRAENKIHHWTINAYTKAIAGGVMLVCLYYFFPPLFGEGYDVVKEVAGGNPGLLNDDNMLLNFLDENWSLLLFTGLIVLLKPLAAAITIGSGGNGGNFAPSLFTGAFLGYFLSKLINNIGWLKMPEGNFSLVGMAGVL